MQIKLKHYLSWLDDNSALCLWLIISCQRGLLVFGEEASIGSALLANHAVIGYAVKM
jgi:hypothetical protein